MGDYIQTGEIGSADIVFSRGFILDCVIEVHFDGCVQCFGGYVLGGNPFSDAKASDHASQPNLAADFIGGVLAVADVDQFSKLKGRIIRVSRKSEFGPIKRIGHAYKNVWYGFEDRMKTFKMQSTK